MRGSEHADFGSRDARQASRDEAPAQQASDQDAPSEPLGAERSACDARDATAALRAAAQELEIALASAAAQPLPERARRSIVRHLSGIKAHIARIDRAQADGPGKTGGAGQLFRPQRAWAAGQVLRARVLAGQAWCLLRKLPQRLTSTGATPDGSGCAGFIDLLTWHLETGTRPTGPKRPWTQQEFAVALHPKGGTASTDESARKSVKNWLTGSAFPNAGYFASIEIALLGPEQGAGGAAHETPEQAAARAQLRAVYQKDRERRRPKAADAGASGRPKPLTHLIGLGLQSRAPARVGGAIAAAAAIFVGILVIFGWASPHSPQAYQPERHIGGFFSLDDLLRSRRFINLDCGYRAIKAGGLEQFRKTESFKGFANAIAFRERGPVPLFLAGVVHALHASSDPENRKRLSALAVGVADKLHPLLLGLDLPTHEYAKLYDSAQREVGAAVDRLKNGSTGVETWRSARATETERASPGPAWCDPSRETHLSAEDFRQAARSSRSVFALVTGLYVFGNATDKATEVAEKAKVLFADDMNVNASLAELLALKRNEGEQLDKPTYARVHRLLERALKQALEEQRIVQDFSPRDGDPVDLEIKRRLLDRYRRAVLDIKLELAFFLANENSRDGWTYAERFVEENLSAYQAEFEESEKNKLKRFPCLDNFMGASILDAYGFVKLTALARDQYMDRRQVRDAMQKLEEAKALIDKIDDERCFSSDGNRKKSWSARVGRHLDWAERLLASSRPAL
jgi:hypothetical protein